MYPQPFFTDGFGALEHVLLFGCSEQPNHSVDFGKKRRELIPLIFNPSLVQANKL